jgi:two-component sensor histidine kinase
MEVEKGRRTIKVEEFIRIRQHVIALAALHDVLTRSAKTDGAVHFLDIKVAMERIQPILQQHAGIRSLNCKIQESRLPLRQGSSLTVVINELVSNAIKHGSGPIDLEISSDGVTMELRVADRGPGFHDGFDPIASASTGLELIEQVSGWDLGGTVQYANRPEGGALVTVRFPIQDESWV